MEEELEREFINDTMVEDYYYPPSYLRIVHEVTTILFAFIGVLSDIIIIYTVARYKILRNKTFILLMNYSINSSIFLLMFPIRLTMFRFHDSCILDSTMACVLGCVMVMLILVINPIMTNEKITIKVILIVLYVVVFILALTKTLHCMFYLSLNYFQLGLMFLYGPLLLIVLASEVMQIINKRRSNVVDEDYMLRLNLARIYTYNLGVLVLLLIIGFAHIRGFHYIADFLVLTFVLSSFYLLLYVVCKEKTFRKCLFSVIRKDEYTIYATLNSAECIIQPDV